MKQKYIYNMRLAGYLMINGIRIIRIEKNIGRPWRNVFVFEDTDKLKQLIEIYKDQKSKENTNGDINKNGKNKSNWSCSEIL